MAYLKNIIFFLLFMASRDCISQGQIEHIKNQEYLKYKTEADCTNSPGDNLAERICANLAFQKSDSILTRVYDSLLLRFKKPGIDSGENKIVTLQTIWREFRNQHCSIIFDSYEGCGGCHQRAIDYLNCLREMTEQRIKELIKLKKQLNY